MSRRKLRVQATPADRIASELRGEVGETVASWIMWSWLQAKLRALQTDDLTSDMRDQDQVFLSLLASRVNDDLVARIAELAARKVGRVNFHFASVKLEALEDEVKAYIRFVKKNRFLEKRNAMISHKELPVTWQDVRSTWIRPAVVAKAVAMGQRLSKRIDRMVLGPAAPFLWREMRKKRYELSAPARVHYMLLPYLRLSARDRVAVAVAEAAEGEVLWEPLETEVDGQKRCVLVNRKWGLIRLGPQTVQPLEHYPLQEITSISTRDDAQDQL